MNTDVEAGLKIYFNVDTLIRIDNPCIEYRHMCKRTPVVAVSKKLELTNIDEDIQSIRFKFFGT